MQSINCILSRLKTLLNRVVSVININSSDGGRPNTRHKYRYKIHTKIFTSKHIYGIYTIHQKVSKYTLKICLPLLHITSHRYGSNIRGANWERCKLKNFLLRFLQNKSSDFLNFGVLSYEVKGAVTSEHFRDIFPRKTPTRLKVHFIH